MHSVISDVLVGSENGKDSHCLTVWKNIEWLVPPTILSEHKPLSWSVYASKNFNLVYCYCATSTVEVEWMNQSEWVEGSSGSMVKYSSSDQKVVSSHVMYFNPKFTWYYKKHTLI